MFVAENSRYRKAMMQFMSSIVSLYSIFSESGMGRYELYGSLISAPGGERSQQQPAACFLRIPRT